MMKLEDTYICQKYFLKLLNVLKIACQGNDKIKLFRFYRHQQGKTGRIFFVLPFITKYI